ncbi:MAG: hypothetical protein N3A63_00085 [Bacteroidetes bacterium]|nr:hypothetical protein [Bacteroidota bacterium]
MSNIFLLVFFQVQLLNAQLQSEYSYSHRAGAATRMGFDARSIGMGNAVTAYIDSAVVSYYNPALLPYHARSSFSVTHGILSLGRSLNTFAYTMHINPNAGFSLTVLNTGVTEIDGRTINGYHTSMLSTSENMFAFSFGIQTSSRLSLGITMKIHYYHLYETVRSTTVGFDIGTLYSVSTGFHVAFVLQDINSKYRWDTSRLYGDQGKTTIDRFPLRKKLSCTYKIPALLSVLGGEYEVIGKNSLFRFGIETLPISSFSLRCGIDEIMIDRGFDPKPSIGTSFKTNILSNIVTVFQYTYCIERYSPMNFHVLTLSFEFL